MDCNEIIIGIFVPLVSALIGGGLTLVGVLMTIKHEKKDEEERQRLSVKPWIYSVNPMEEYDYKNAKDIIFSVNDRLSTGIRKQVIIRNTDNGILIFEKIETKHFEYKPLVGNVMDKNSVCNLNIELEENDDIDNCILYIRDIFNNSYRYKIICQEDNVGMLLKEV